MQRTSKEFLRDNFLGLSLTLVGLACLALTGVLYLNHRTFSGFAVAGGAGLDGADIEMLERQNKAYERIAQAVTPAIVNIQSTQVIKVQQSPFFNDPFFRQFFGDMFGNIPREQREHALGSGVIVSPEGYIVTNNHVVAQGGHTANDIKVLLPDKREFKGKVVGADPQTDVAVIKINASGLPAAPLGDSASLHVGDTVMAFGNPFGLNFTVTRGSVSAIGRSGLGIEQYEDFIQTDAAINHGNSGGALVNVRGQIVGINVAILSPSAGPSGEGGWSGVGFAIPSSIVKHVMDSLVKTGKVSRGYIGVNLEELTPQLARQFDVPGRYGVLVSQVETDSPADKAGLKQGDVVQSFNGQKVDDLNNLRFLVADTSPNSQVTLGIVRDGKPMTVKITLSERPLNIAEGGRGGGMGKPSSEGALRGISVEDLTPAIREQLRLPRQTHGVVIDEVDPSSPAAQAGLERGDVIETINRKPVNTADEFQRLASQAKGDVLLYVVGRQGNAGFVVISPEGEQ